MLCVLQDIMFFFKSYLMILLTKTRVNVVAKFVSLKDRQMFRRLTRSQQEGGTIRCILRARGLNDG